MNTICQHCGQVTPDKTGADKSCQHCGKSLDAPPVTDNIPRVDLSRHDKATASESPSGELAGGEVLSHESADADLPNSGRPPEHPVESLDEFAVFDDDSVARPQSKRGAGLGRAVPPLNDDVDYHRIAVPRSVLYLQGVLLGVVAVGFFLLGILVGLRIDGPDETAAVMPRPCVVTGSVAFLNESDQKIPDVGAVVILLPSDQLPQQKYAPHGLRPTDERPEEGHTALGAIREIGGDYGRTDNDGRYELLVTGSHAYFVLIISSRLRKQSEQLAKRDLAELGSYFLPADELIGDHRYIWYRIASIRGTRKRLPEALFR